MNNYIGNAPDAGSQTNYIASVDCSVPTADTSSAFQHPSDAFINDLTKTTFGQPDPNKIVIGICNYGDGYIYL